MNYLFDSAATDDMRFGQSVAASAGYVLIGSPDDGEAASSAGAVWMIDLVGAHAPLKFFSPAPTANGEFGNAVALSGNLALIGDPNADPLGANEGRADLFVVDGETATPLRNLLPAEVQAFDFVGSAVALCGSGAAIGAPGDDSSGFSAGAAYHVKNLSGPLPFDSVARKGDTAPGAIDAEFNLFKQPAINSQGAVSFTASLTGPGSNRNRDTGGWIKTPGLAPIEPVVKSRDMLDALGAGFAATKANAILSTNWDTAPGAFFETTLTGPGVTSSNNRVIIAGNLDDDRIFETVPLLRTGDPLAALGGAMVKSFAEIASAIDPIVAYTLKTGDAGVTTANDTGLLAVDAGGSGIVSAFREGDSDSFGVWGQFFGR
ncbi:MAG: FG-GAP repeat protein, partial [Verrucomicrobiae bacterium]|nr:FG-GAP repeat protein [Verrucomicrobiae bacterium]